ncbi:MAG: hypothetical protein RIT10_722 [Bacteroidota bacterium]|jgi:hypothetical protein
MKHNILLVLTFIGISSLAMSQTKRIAFKSHSGNETNFKTALAVSLFENEGSNFGIAPQRYVTEAHLDTVIFINDTTVELVTSHHSNFVDDYRISTHPNLWKPGHETVVNHPVFNSDKTIEEMKEIVQKTYHFKNDISKVVFIGEPKVVKKNIKRKQKNTLKNGFIHSGNPFFLFLFGAGMISIISFVFKPFAIKK